MKHIEFLHELEGKGCVVCGDGKRHELVLNPATGRKAPLPRHAEVKDSLCVLSRLQLGIVG